MIKKTDISHYKRKFVFQTFVFAVFFLFASMLVAETVCLFDEQPTMAEDLYRRVGGAMVSLETTDVFSGARCLKVTPPGAFACVIELRGQHFPWEYYVAESPVQGEFRYILFAWKKTGGSAIAMMLINDSYENYNQNGYFIVNDGSSLNLTYPHMKMIKTGSSLPDDWQYVIRDLYADFGEMMITGIHLRPENGEYALYDSIYLSSTREELELMVQKINNERK